MSHGYFLGAAVKASLLPNPPLWTPSCHRTVEEMSENSPELYLKNVSDHARHFDVALKMN